ncbi:MAG: 3-oxoacyl-[acyl-carrier-protein] reductase [Ruminococcaceae bacterium]|jgi:3-oxoacyl-[acyl-carrier protein] reductase|nr:3-oxoacyl-[acyl-carrier-protein] reductase [Oscillospiraceae bacterium]
MLALITGGSRGIGAAAALKLASDGWDIALTYRNEREKAEQVAISCRERGVKAAVYAIDLSCENDIKTLHQQISNDLGPVSVLVNNAGMNRDGLSLRMSREQFTSVVDANLTGTFLMCQAFLSDMIRARNGRIINIVSVAAIYGNAGQVNYAAAKAGIIGLTRSLAKEVASRQVTVNAIAPGFIETDMTLALSESIRTRALQSIALGRFGKPDDVAGLVAYLASPSSGYLTGQVIEISGGLSL